MFQRILQFVRDWINKMINPSSVKSALHVDTIITPLMADALQKWSLMYTNNSPWLSGDIKSLNLAASIAGEVARAVTIEMDVQVSGSARADFLAEQIASVLNSIRIYAEYGAAKGGLWLKPYIKGDGLAVDYVQADMGYPVAFDANGNMTAVVFADQRQIGTNYYTRLEYHQLSDEGYRITNTAFRSTVRDVLGNQISLTTLADWVDIEPEAMITGIDKPLFAYFKMPFANNVDPTSPLGVSVYSRAVGLIEQADRLYSNLLWEFESGKRAVYTDILAFGKDDEGKPVLPDKRLYRLLDLNSKIDGKGFFEDWTPEFREAAIKSGLNDIKREIEFLCGLAYGTISDPEAVSLTATEIISSKQRSQATVVDTQKSLRIALEQLVYAMDVWATLGSLAPAGTYTTSYQFDDSIVTDYDAQFTQDQQTVTMGNMPGYVFLMRNYSLSEEDAKKWVTEAQAEKPAPSFFPNEIGV
jgi:A118 family predicted phage portal protein